MHLHPRLHSSLYTGNCKLTHRVFLAVYQTPMHLNTTEDQILSHVTSETPLLGFRDFRPMF